METSKKQTPNLPVLAVKIPDAGRMLGISRSKSYDMASRGVIPTVTIDGVVRVPIDALRKMVSGEAA